MANMNEDYDAYLQQVAGAMTATVQKKEEDQKKQEKIEKKERKIIESGKPTKKMMPRYVLSQEPPPQSEEDGEAQATNQPSEIFSVRFSPDSEYMAAGYGNGLVKVFLSASGKEKIALNAGGREHMPITCLRWRPHGNMRQTRHVVCSINAVGVVQHWHVLSGKLLYEISEPDNQLYCVDYAPDASQFAVGGRKREVHVYDESTKDVKCNLKEGDDVHTTGHALRIWSVKYHPRENNILVSGGWDQTVQIWDQRLGRSVRSIYGPMICGDAIDISDDGSTILTGSFRGTEQLQLWDFGSGKLIQNVPWRNADLSVKEKDGCTLYCAQFSKDSSSGLVAAGGGANSPAEACVFDRKANFASLGLITGMSKCCYSLDFAPDGSMLAVAGGDSIIRVMDLASTITHTHTDH